MKKYLALSDVPRKFYYEKTATGRIIGHEFGRSLNPIQDAVISAVMNITLALPEEIILSDEFAMVIDNTLHPHFVNEQRSYCESYPRSNPMLQEHAKKINDKMRAINFFFDGHITRIGTYAEKGNRQVYFAGFEGDSRWHLSIAFTVVEDGEIVTIHPEISCFGKKRGLGNGSIELSSPEADKFFLSIPGQEPEDEPEREYHFSETQNFSEQTLDLEDGYTLVFCADEDGNVKSTIESTLYMPNGDSLTRCSLTFGLPATINTIRAAWPTYKPWLEKLLAIAEANAEANAEATSKFERFFTVGKTRHSLQTRKSTK